MKRKLTSGIVGTMMLVMGVSSVTYAGEIKVQADTRGGTSGTSATVQSCVYTSVSIPITLTSDGNPVDWGSLYTSNTSNFQISVVAGQPLSITGGAYRYGSGLYYAFAYPTGSNAKWYPGRTVLRIVASGLVNGVPQRGETLATITAEPLPGTTTTCGSGF